MQLGLIAQLAASLAKDEVREVARVAKTKAILIGVATVFAVIALVMCIFGAYLLLSQEIGDILAAFAIAGGCIGLAIAFLLASLLVKKRKTHTPKLPDAQLSNATPYLALAAFAIGFLKGRK